MAVKAERGKFLTILIVLGVLSWLANLPQILGMNQNFEALGIAMPSWFIPYTLIAGVLQIAIFVGIWYWKKWAVYGLFAIAGLALVINIFVLGSMFSNKPYGLTAMYFTNIMSVAGVGLWFWAIYRKWQYFK